MRLRRRAVALALLALLTAGCERRAPTWREILLRREVSPADLRLAARRCLEERPDVAAVTADGELGLRVKLRSGGEHAVHLDNLLRGLAADRMARPAQLEDFLATVRDQPAGAALDEADRRRLLPLVKDALFLVALREAGTLAEPLERPLAGDLVVLYVIDSAESVRYVDGRALSELGLSAAAAPRVALENFRARTPEHHWETDGALRHLRADGTYEASFLLLPELWDGVAAELGGEPVVAVPARGELAVAVNLPENRAALYAWAHQLADSAPYAMLDELFAWRDGAWVQL